MIRRIEQAPLPGGVWLRLECGHDGRVVDPGRRTVDCVRCDRQFVSVGAAASGGHMRGRSRS